MEKNSCNNMHGVVILSAVKRHPTIPGNMTLIKHFNLWSNLKGARTALLGARAVNCYLLRNMALPYTKEVFEMPSASATDGSQHTSQPIAYVAKHSTSTMPSTAHAEASHQCGTTKSETSLLRYSQKFAMVWAKNHTYNQLQKNCCHTEPRTEKMVLASILLQRTSGEETGHEFFDIRVLTRLLRYKSVNPLAKTYQNISMAQCYRRNELEKRRA